MSSAASSAFTAADAAAWPTLSGTDAFTWVHATVSGTFSTGPTTDILSNAGQSSGKVSAVAIRTHDAGAANLLHNGVVSTKFKRSNIMNTIAYTSGNIDAGIFAKRTGTGASTNMIVFHTTYNAATKVHAFCISSVVAGVWTVLTVYDLDMTVDTYYWLRLGFREDPSSSSLAIAGEVWTTDPLLGGAPTTTITATATAPQVWANNGTCGVLELFNKTGAATLWTVTYDDFNSSGNFWTQPGLLALALSNMRYPVAINQTAKARIQVTGNVATTTGTARIQATSTKTTTGVARISVVGNVKTTTGVARIQVTGNVKTTTGTARIQATSTKTTTGTARISVVSTKTTTALARISVAGNVKTTTGVARIAVVSTKTTTATARISVTGNVKTQTATARISVAGNTKTQPATARVSRTYTATQTAGAYIAVGGTSTATTTGTARIQVTSTKTTTGTARISVAGNTKTQAATARIQVTGNVKTQAGVARISVTGKTKTTTGVARISVAGNVKTQAATARISVVGSTKTTTGTARVQVVGSTKTTTATARVSKSATLTQGALARIAVVSTKSQTATARVRATGTATITGTAAISTGTPPDIDVGDVETAWHAWTAAPGWKVDAPGVTWDGRLVDR